LNTLAVHLAVATASATPVLSRSPWPATAAPAAQAAGVAILIAVVAVAALVMAIASATHYMTAMLTEMLRVARMAMAFFFALVLVTLVSFALLIHR
jgi:hypothetical protein